MHAKVPSSCVRRCHTHHWVHTCACTRVYSYHLCANTRACTRVHRYHSPVCKHACMHTFTHVSHSCVQTQMLPEAWENRFKFKRPILKGCNKITLKLKGDLNLHSGQGRVSNNGLGPLLEAQRLCQELGHCFGPAAS